LKVVIIQRVLPHYRVPFFRALHAALAQQSIELLLIYGQELNGSVPKSVDIGEPWAVRIENRYFEIFNYELIWQPCWRYLAAADLVIVEQANRLLVNYGLQFIWRGDNHKLAFWGHGTNFQARSKDRLNSRLKNWLACRVDGWFAYTELSAKYLRRVGVRSDSMTVVQNSIDSDGLRAAAEVVSDQQLAALRIQLGLRSQQIGLYCGGLHTDKRLDFLLAAADAIKDPLADFELIVIGEGPLSGVIEAAAASRDWLHYVGPIFGHARVPYFKLAQVMLMPGLVGLVIVDSFVLGLPLFTTDNGIHSPEIAYLENGVNGVMSDNTLEDYVDQVVSALSDSAYLHSLQLGCHESALRYTLNTMVERFAGGVVGCLEVDANQNCQQVVPAAMAEESEQAFPRTVIVTNIPAPYRIPIYQRLAVILGAGNFHVIYCADNEANRDWLFDRAGFDFTVLRACQINWYERYIHVNLDVIDVLKRFSPEVVITTGFNPTHLLAFAYALFGRCKHIPQTDGTFESEQRLYMVHRLARRLVFASSNVFIGASEGSMRLYQHYRIARSRCFQSHLCANNAEFLALPDQAREFDLMFSGRFASEKNPEFALDVAAGVAKRLGRKLSVLMLGSGPLLEKAKAHAASLAEQLSVVFPGFVQQAELPGFYASAKVFLFPSSWDPWGVVANEACAAGQAVIVSPHAGVANELIRNGENGFVCELDLALWIEKATLLLSDPELLASFSTASRQLVEPYNFDAAAQGVVDAVQAAIA
jgi:glycosyltransferase involved in cell wall biosynthesis